MPPEKRLCKKKRYNDPLAAGRTMAAMHILGKNNKDGRVRVYFCDQCDAWHWGHTRMVFVKK